MRHDYDLLAETGSNVTPWLLIGGIIVLLGVIALIVAGLVRSRRDEHQVEDAAAAVADAGGTLPAPDPNASAAEETVIDEASELGDAGTPLVGSTAGGSAPAGPEIDEAAAGETGNAASADDEPDPGAGETAEGGDGTKH